MQARQSAYLLIEAHCSMLNKSMVSFLLHTGKVQCTESCYVVSCIPKAFITCSTNVQGWEWGLSHAHCEINLFLIRARVWDSTVGWWLVDNLTRMYMYEDCKDTVSVCHPGFLIHIASATSTATKSQNTILWVVPAPVIALTSSVTTMRLLTYLMNSFSIVVGSKSSISSSSSPDEKILNHLQRCCTYSANWTMHLQFTSRPISCS